MPYQDPIDLMRRLTGGQPPPEAQGAEAPLLPDAAFAQRPAAPAGAAPGDEEAILARLGALQTRADTAFNDYEAARNLTPAQRKALDQAQREKDYFGFDPKGKKSFFQKLKVGLAKTGSLLSEAQGQPSAISRRPIEDFEKKREEEMGARLGDAQRFMTQLGAAQDDYRMQRKDRDTNAIQQAKVEVAARRAEVEAMAASGKLTNEGIRLAQIGKRLEAEGRVAEARAAYMEAKTASEVAREGFTGPDANDLLKSKKSYEDANAMTQIRNDRLRAQAAAQALFKGGGGGSGGTISTTTKTPPTVDANGRTIPGSSTTVSRKGGGGAALNPLAAAALGMSGPAPTSARTPSFVPEAAPLLQRPPQLRNTGPQLPAAAGGLTPNRAATAPTTPKAPAAPSQSMARSRYLQLALDEGQYTGDPRGFPAWQKETTKAADQMSRSNSVFIDTARAAADGKLGLGQEWRDNLSRSLGVPSDIKDSAVRFARAEENFRRTLKDISGTAFGVQEAESWKRIMGSADLKSNQYGMLAISGLQAMASQVGHLRSLTANNSQKAIKLVNPEITKRVNERLTHMTNALQAYEKGDKTQPLVVKVRDTKSGKWVDRRLPRERFADYLERVVDMGDDLREAIQ